MFWHYDPVSDNRLQLEDVPVGAGKYVEAGGAFTANSDLLYALKGNGTDESYCYVPSAAVIQQTPTGEAQTRYLQIAEELGFMVLPNPTRGQAILRLILPEPATISLKVYDAAGRKVRSAAYGLCPGGYSALNLPSTELPAGVYWLQLTAGEQTICRKMIIEP